MHLARAISGPKRALSVPTVELASEFAAAISAAMVLLSEESISGRSFASNNSLHGKLTRRCQFAASWSTQCAARPDQSAASCFGTDAL